MLRTPVRAIGSSHLSVRSTSRSNFHCWHARPSDSGGRYDPTALREALHRLFALLRDDDSARNDFLTRVAEEVRGPVRDRADLQIQRSDALSEVFEARGGLETLTEEGVRGIIVRVGRWLTNDLGVWMTQIHSTVDETVWLGEQFSGGGAIDILLLADAVGLNAYMWNLEPGESPFRRLDVVGGVADTGMLVLSELYAQSMPIQVGMA